MMDENVKANLFDVLNTMNAQHIGSVHAYFSDNVQNIHAGSKGWGNIKIAITTEDAQEIMNGILRGKASKTILLFVIDREIMDQTKTKIEETLITEKQEE